MNDLANYIGFGSFKGMVLYFSFLAVIAFVGYGVYIGQKGKN